MSDSVSEGSRNLGSRIAADLDTRYELKSELGHGGMAHVFLAHDRKLNRGVAVKVLRPEIAAVVGASRFLQEIDIVARLQHPLIVPIHDCGSAAGLPFYVMPYIEGQSLRDHLRSVGELPVEETVRITRDVAEALRYAHAHGVVHRDIKPENILLSGDRAVITDFGIAQAFTEAGGAVVTETGVAVGTPQYMSPEQGTGERRLDGRSDIYSVGCVLYEMLAGGPPFDGPSQRAVLARHLHENVPSLRIVRPVLPPRLLRVVKRCLEKSAADRYQSADQLIQALERALEPGRGPTWLRAAGISGGALIVAGLAIGLWPRGTVLDDNRIIVFPLARIGEGPLPQDAGELVSGVIASALEYTEPLTWLPGGASIVPDEDGGRPRIPEAEADRISRDKHARYRISGDLLMRGDAADVVLRLHDVRSDAQILQRTVSGPATLDAVVQSGLEAVRQLLPALLASGRRVDWAAFEGRDPSAVVRWMQGEQAYRAARFTEASDLYQRALERDSTLAMAALKGAIVVGWLGGSAPWVESARLLDRLLQLALAYEELLPPRHREFARGLRHYYGGRPDSALVRFNAAVAADTLWLEPRVMVGETYGNHLTPARDWRARMRTSFEFVLAHDSSFMPAALELGADALRTGDWRSADRLLRRAERAVPEQRLVQSLRMGVACLRDGVNEQQWDASAEEYPLETLAAAVMLGGSDSGVVCAEAGFQTLRRTASATPYQWGTLVAYQSFLLGTGQLDRAEKLLDSEPLGRYLRLVATPMGLASDSGSTQLVAQFHETFRSLDAVTLWLYGQWVAQQDSARLMTALAREARQRADSSQGRVDRLVADVLDAHAALASGDTVLALRRFEGLAPSGTLADIAWQPWESFPAERLMLAKVLIAQGAYARADSVLTLLEHPQPLIYRAFRQEVRKLRERPPGT